MVPIKNQNAQPPKCILNALFYKMKADYLRYIYECLSGENGLLVDFTLKVSFVEDLEIRIKNDISEEEKT